MQTLHTVHSECSVPSYAAHHSAKLRRVSLRLIQSTLAQTVCSYYLAPR